MHWTLHGHLLSSGVMELDISRQCTTHKTSTASPAARMTLLRKYTLNNFTADAECSRIVGGDLFQCLLRRWLLSRSRVTKLCCSVASLQPSVVEMEKSLGCDKYLQQVACRAGIEGSRRFHKHRKGVESN